MPLSDEHIRALLVACRDTHDEEIDCDAFLTRLPEFAEARAQGRAPAPAFAQVAAHERLCPNCREECSALVELLRTGDA